MLGWNDCSQASQQMLPLAILGFSLGQPVVHYSCVPNQAFLEAFQSKLSPWLSFFSLDCSSIALPPINLVKQGSTGGVSAVVFNNLGRDGHGVRQASNVGSNQNFRMTPKGMFLG